MHNKVNILFDLITPFKLCSDLGLKVRPRGLSCFVEDPNSSNEIYITDTDFISKQVNSNFQIGNIVDFLVYVKEISYSEAVTYLLDNYLARLENPLLNSIVWAKASLVTYLESLALVSGRLLRPSTGQEGQGISKSRAFLESYDLTELTASRLLTIKSGREILDVFGEVKSQHIQPKLNSVQKSATYLVMPYYATYHLPAVIDLYDVNTDKRMSLVLAPYKHAFFGLRSVSPESPGPTLFDNSLQVLSYYANYLKHGELGAGCVSSKKVTSGTLEAPKLDRGLAIYDSTKTGLPDIIDGLGFVKELRLMPSSGLFTTKFKDAKNARDFVLNNFVSLLVGTDECSEHIVKYLNVIRTDHTLYTTALDILKSKGRTDILVGINSFFRESAPLEVKGYQILTTRDGYIAKKQNVNQPFTNFSIKLDKTLIFRNTSDTYYKGTVFSGDRQFPILLSKKESQKATEIINASISAVSSLLDNESDLRVPTLLDSTFARHLPSIIAHEINNTQVEVGVNSLGWSDNKTFYQAACWRAKTTGIEYTNREKHPGEPQLKLFNNTTVSTEKTQYNDTIGNTFLAIIASYLCRSYLDLPTPALQIKNTNYNQQLVRSVTAPFGQTAILDINANNRTASSYLNLFSGYPIWCQCASPDIIKSLDNPLFLLSENGITLRETDIDFDKLQKFAEWLIPNMVHNIMVDKAAWFQDLSLKREKFVNLIFEGSCVIKQFLGTTFTVEDLIKFPIFYRYMAERDLPKIEFSLKDQLVRISDSGYGVTRQELRAEFESADINCSVGKPWSEDNRRYLLVDSKPILGLLSDFYGEAPVLKSFTLPEKQANSEEIKQVRQAEGPA